MSRVLFVKADWSARYQRLLERRTGGDPEAMAAEDAKFVDLASSLVRADEPTPAQAAAGRYPKRAMPWKGLTIRIENEAGSVRRGTKPDGSPWETRMAFPYGEIARTEGVDGDPVDVFIGPLAETADTVFVIHQRRVDDWEHYDEDKCMIGWLTEAEAVAAFLQCYDDPRFLGPVTAMPVAEFIEKAKATRTAPKMIKAELIKGHVGPYIRQGKLVNIHGYDGRAARAEKAPGQGSLFTELEVREAARKKADPERFDHTKTGDLFEQHEDLDSKSAPLVKQTETPQFRAWFGDSKVTRDGEPLRMYHASHRDFDTFDRRKSVEWRRMETMDTVGSWFSDTPSKDGGAGMYADGEGAAIYPVYLSIQKPKFYQTFDEFLNDMHLAAGRDPAKQNPKGRGTTEELREKLKAEGYDGIRFGRTYNRKLWDHAGKLATEVQAAKDAEWAAPRAERQPLTEKRELAEKKLREWRNKLGTNTSTEFDNQEVWIAFEPEQIKSAIGNNGDFSKDSPVITKSILFIKAKARGDDRTADMFGTHLETHARKDGVVQAYHVANAKKDVVIPGHIKQHLDRFVSPAHDAAGALARGRETDKKFRGEGRYAAEVWQDHKPKIEKMHADIEAMLAGIPDEANREAARAHIHGQMPDLSLTDEESGYFRSKKDAALDAAISHLKEDAQQADMPAHEKAEDRGLVAKLIEARGSDKLPEAADEKLLSDFPPGFHFREGKGTLGRGKWGVADEKGDLVGGLFGTKTDAVSHAKDVMHGRAQFAEQAKQRAATEANIATKLLSGKEPSKDDIKALGLKEMADFAYLSPVVQRLFGISKAKVREAMGDALRPVYNDMGTQKWRGSAKSALMNAAAWKNGGQGELKPARKAAKVESVKPPEDLEKFIKVAADSIGQLRRIDVLRVLESNGLRKRELARYIAEKRPDLAQEVKEVMEDEMGIKDWMTKSVSAPIVKSIRQIT